MSQALPPSVVTYSYLHPLEEAPKDATELVAVIRGHRAVIHWASDLSGEEQPPFRGWFRWDGGRGYVQVLPADIEGWIVAVKYVNGAGAARMNG